MEVVWSGIPNVLFVAAFLTLIYTLGDSLIVRHVFKEEDKFVRALTYVALGSTVGLVVFFLLFQTPATMLIDSSFVSIGAVSSVAMKSAIFAGIAGAIFTIIYIYAFSTGLDVSVVIPLTSLTVAYITVGELINGRVTVSQMGLPVVLVIVGVFVALAWSTDWKVSGGMLALLLVVHNIAKMFDELVSKAGVAASDPISFTFYRFFWLTVAAWVLIAAITLGKGTFKVWINSLVQNFNLRVGLIVVVQMVIVFFGMSLGTRGLDLSNATTKSLVMSVPVVLAVIVSAIVNKFWTGAFEERKTTFSQWVLRGVGTALMVLGVLVLQIMREAN